MPGGNVARGEAQTWRTVSRGIAIVLSPFRFDDQRRDRGDRSRNDDFERRAAAGIDADGNVAAQPFHRLAHDVQSDAAAGHIR